MERERQQPNDSDRSSTSSTSKKCEECVYYDPPLTFGGYGWGTCDMVGRMGAKMGCSKLYVEKDFYCYHWYNQ